MKISKIMGKKIAVIAIAAAGALAAGSAGAAGAINLKLQNVTNSCARVYTNRSVYQDIMPKQFGVIPNAPVDHKYTVSFFSGRCGGKAIYTQEIKAIEQFRNQPLELGFGRNL